MPQSLLTLPNEVLHNILIQIRSDDVHDLAQLSKTCRRLDGFIRDDEPLWRYHYSFQLDMPEENELGSGFSWREELTNVLQMKRILLSDDDDCKWSNLELISDTVLYLIQTQNVDSIHWWMSHNIRLLNRLFGRIDNCTTILCQSSLHQRALTVPASQDPIHDPNPDEEQYSYLNKTGLYHASKTESQLSARLHCLHRLDGPDDGPGKWNFSTTHKVYACARSIVYDRRGRGSLWGPFLDKDSQVIDWESLEAAQYVFEDNMQHFWDFNMIDLVFNWSWKDGHFRGVGPDGFFYGNTPVEPPREPCDPYNITGTWTCITCRPEGHTFDTTDSLDSERIGMAAGLPVYIDYDKDDKEEDLSHSRMELRVVEVRHSNTEGESLPEVRFVGLATLLTGGYDTDLVQDIEGRERSQAMGVVSLLIQRCRYSHIPTSWRSEMESHYIGVSHQPECHQNIV